MPGELDDEVMREWPVWRLVIEGTATLDEIERAWSLDDVQKANAILDMRADIQRANAPQPERPKR